MRGTRVNNFIARRNFIFKDEEEFLKQEALHLDYKDASKYKEYISPIMDKLGFSELECHNGTFTLYYRKNKKRVFISFQTYIWDGEFVLDGTYVDEDFDCDRGLSDYLIDTFINEIKKSFFKEKKFYIDELISRFEYKIKEYEMNEKLLEKFEWLPSNEPLKIRKITQDQRIEVMSGEEVIPLQSTINAYIVIDDIIKDTCENTLTINGSISQKIEFFEGKRVELTMEEEDELFNRLDNIFKEMFMKEN
jgi:hypothetical protein